METANGQNSGASPAAFSKTRALCFAHFTVPSAKPLLCGTPPSLEVILIPTHPIDLDPSASGLCVELQQLVGVEPQDQDVQGPCVVEHILNRFQHRRALVVRKCCDPNHRGHLRRLQVSEVTSPSFEAFFSLESLPDASLLPHQVLHLLHPHHAIEIISSSGSSFPRGPSRARIIAILLQDYNPLHLRLNLSKDIQLSAGTRLESSTWRRTCTSWSSSLHVDASPCQESSKALNLKCPSSRQRSPDTPPLRAVVRLLARQSVSAVRNMSSANMRLPLLFGHLEDAWTSSPAANAVGDHLTKTT